MLRYVDSLDLFTAQHPGLLYAVMAIIGCFLGVSPHWCLAIPFLIAVVPLFHHACPRPLKMRLFLAFFLAAGFWVYASQYALLPTSDPFGTASITLHTAKPHQTFFGPLWKYTAVIDTFEGDEPGRNIPCVISLPFKTGQPPLALGKHYTVFGQLKKTLSGSYFLKVNKHEVWALKNDSAWPPIDVWRYQAKQSVAGYIKKRYHYEHTASFLTGIATGEFDSPDIQRAFGRFGLQHIMAISGFHFAIIATILNLILRLIFPSRWNIPLLIFFLSSYFIFLGCGASILRAWLSLLIALSAQLCHRQSNGINTLGIAIVCILLYDPLMCTRMGFQFSTLTTAAILLFFTPIDTLMGSVLIRRSLSDLLSMPALDQCGYLILKLIRQGLSLSIAVNLAAAPLILFYFGKFPLLSLFYNLFFPFFVSISMLLLILGILENMCLPFFDGCFHKINDHFTDFVLGLTLHLPTSLDIMIRVPFFSPAVLSLWLTALFVAAILIKKWVEEKQEAWEQLIFV